MKKILSFILVIAVALAIPLTAFAEEANINSDEQKTYLSYPQFRGDTLAQGLIDSKTPINSEDTVEKWAASFGSGWSSTPGTPIIVGDYLYVVVPGQAKLYRVSLETGEALKSVDCPGSSQFFSTIAYNNGIIFVPRAKTISMPDPEDSSKKVHKSVSVIYAYDETTMEKLWETAPIGNPDDQNQPLSAVTFYNNYVYIGVSHGSADKGAFACFDTVDTDKNSCDEVKEAVWTYMPQPQEDYDVKCGYYWSGGAIVNNAIIFGGEATELVIHSLTEDKVYDRIVLEENPDAGIRSTVHYDAQTGRVFTTTKSGFVYSIKINGDNTFDKSSLKSTNIGADITSSPVVFNGRLYIGGGGIGSNAGFSVLDAETLEIIYQIEDIKSQSSPIISTAYATAKNDYQVYIYVVKFAGFENNDYSGYSPTSSCVFCISDKQGQTEPEYDILITPSKLQYCSQSVAIDGNGTLYYYNDAGSIYAMGHKNPDDEKFTAQDVINAVNLMESQGKVTARDEFMVKRLMARYNQLTSSEQEKVTNFDKLEAMLKRIELLKNEDVIVKELNKKIALIDIDSVTLEDDTNVSKLFAAYNSLSEDSKAKVLNIEILKEAVEKIQGIKDENAIASVNEKIDNLPSVISVTFDDKAEIYYVVNLVENQNEIVKAGINNEKLNEIKIKVDLIETSINQLNEDIFGKLDPMNITHEDNETVQKLVSDYNSLNEKDRKHIKNYDDVLYAQKVIFELENNNVISEVFQYLAGSDKDYTVSGTASDGKEYAFTFNGLDITDPSLSFNSEISFASDNNSAIKELASDAVILNFAHKGNLPGKATVQIAVDLEDGQYSLYYFNDTDKKAEFVKKVTVADGKAEFEITHCSDYFITAKSDLSDDRSADRSADRSDDNESKPTPSQGQENNISEQEDNPKTGDTDNLYLVVFAMIISLGTIAAINRKQRVK